MTEDNLATQRARYRDIDRQLDAAAASGIAGAGRAALKADIFALFKAVDGHLAELTTLRDEIRTLVEKWKALQAAAVPSVAPQFTAEKPAVVADHIGASTFIEKGWSRLSLGDYEAAEVALKKAIELSPGDPQSEALLGWAQMLQEKYDAALATFQKVLAREPSNALARINVGYICLKKGTFGEAIEHLSKAIRLDNDRKATLYAHFYLGLVYLERKMFEDAQVFFQKTLVLGPNLIEAYYEMGRAYWFNDQTAEAIKTWKAGHATNKFNPWGKRCADVLATVEAGGQPPK